MMLHDMEGVALLALGGNLYGRLGPPWQAMAWAVLHLVEAGQGGCVSSLWRTEPVGGGRQPAYHNAVIALAWQGRVETLMRLLKKLEKEAGRLAGRSWGPRVLDIDLLAYGSQVIRPVGMGRRAHGTAVHLWQRRGLVLPHPAMHERAFVLLPLAEVAPRWRHPLFMADVQALIARLDWRRKAACQRLQHGRAAQVWRGLATDVHSRGCVVD